ncbi:MAG: aminotransferase class III-fold pyridoxal phosphate-dependent enzyme [Thermoplasmata archaeon]|nr:aminotransferase class III-fold pyridoxal phosphate-dependent enzyme [Thermoplasmata archaeon]
MSEGPSKPEPLSAPAVGSSGSSAAYWARYKVVAPKYFWAEETRSATIVVAGAEGSTLRDADGKTYIDLTSQWSTNNLGNVHPEVLRATIDALEQYGFLIYFLHPHLPMIELAEKLLEIRPSPNLSRVFLELSGTGAVEAAVKHAVETSRRPLVLSFLGQYHGLSIGTGAIGSLSSEERRHWEPYHGGAVHAPYPFPYRRPPGMSEVELGESMLGYLEDQLLRYEAAPDRIAAAILEPVACEAGIWIPPANFVRGLRKLCDAHGWYFIADEVETGLGRTGSMWAIDHFGVAPDMVTIGKAIGGGLMPIAAVLGDERAMGEEGVAAGTTFGGHPAACVAASTTIDILRRDRLAERSARLGTLALRRMEEWRKFDGVGDVRGLGLCLGVELVKEKDPQQPDPTTTRSVFFDCVAHGTLPLYNYGDNVIRIQPPLTIDEPMLDQALDTLESSLRHQLSRTAG